MGGQMAKRLTGTEVWSDPWFRKLEPRLKCFWKYLCDNCDIAGVWKADYELASFQIGADVCEADVEAFGKRLELLGEGKIHITGFIEYQYKNSLKHWVKPQMAVINLLKKHGLTERYANCIETVLDKDKDIDKDMDKDKIKDILRELEVLSDNLLEAYHQFNESRIECKKNALTERAIRMQVKNMLEHKLSIAQMVSCIEASIANNWQGLFPEKISGIKPQPQKGRFHSV